jgi:competence protein ComEC
VAPARDPLVLPLAAFLCGVVLARYARFTALELSAGIAAVIILWAIARWKSSRTRALPAYILLVFVGCGVNEYHQPLPRPELTEEDNQVLVVAGCVVDPPSDIPEVSRFVVELEPGASVRVSLTARDGEMLPPLRFGHVVEIEARVRRPVNFGNAGAFDFAGYLARQNIYWTASARGADKLKILPGRCGGHWRAAWFDARAWALQRVKQLFAGDSYTNAMMSGMLLGDAAAIERSWTEDFRRTGTYHTLVISGLHITVLAGALLTVLRLCFVPMGTRIAVAALAAWAYALLTGMQTPVARSAAGFTLFLVASYFYRRGRVLNLLAVVAGAFLIADPDQVADASFQLSFLAVAAIGALAIPVMDRTSAPLRAALRGLAQDERDAAMPAPASAFRVELRLIAETLSTCTSLPVSIPLRVIAAVGKGAAYIYDLVLVSAAIQFALVLPSVAYFHRLSITSLTANAFVVPVLSAAVPFGFVAIVTGWIPPAVIAGWLLSASRSVVQWHSHFEPARRVPDLPLTMQFTVAFALIILAGSVYFSLRYRFVAAVTVLTVVVVGYLHPFAPDHDGRLEVTTIDVGQGDSHLVVVPNGKIVLIDGGGIPSFDPKFKPKLEIGEDVVSPYLWTRGIRRIDAVALTHAHDDHARGLLAVVENFRPTELWTSSMPSSGVWLELERKARALGVEVVPRHAGERWKWGDVSFQVLAPAAILAGAAAHNNDSLVLQMAYGKHSFLLTGDIERNVEQELVSTGVVGRVDVLKVPHHGSRTSSGPEILELLRPTFGVISAGRYNSYRHPHPEVLERFESASTRILRTDQYGAITFESDGRRIFLDTHVWHKADSGVRHPFAGE